MNIVDLAYGSKLGLNQAIDLSLQILENVPLVEEKKILTTYFDAINRELGTVAYGVKFTMKAFEIGAVETLICHEDLKYQRIEFRNKGEVEQNDIQIKFDLNSNSKPKVRHCN